MFVKVQISLQCSFLYAWMTWKITLSSTENLGIVYNNDISNQVLRLFVIMYADDTVVSTTLWNTKGLSKSIRLFL